jgi:S-adenosylhomocysteine hydrolase
MSFSFTASGTPAEAIATVGQEAANQPCCPQAFADAINGELGALPADSSVSISCYGHTGFGSAQTKGEIGLHVTINVTTSKHPSAETAE